MKLLLDTHTLLWWLDDAKGRLAVPAQRAIAAPRNLVFISAASLWEIVIKKALGKLACPGDLKEAVEDSGFHLLPVTADHALAVERLPPHHRDPFDRMLIAQAGEEGLTIITADAAFRPYGVPLLQAA